jgi:curli biogenesis system outer membrane secretion channel CsgG
MPVRTNYGSYIFGGLTMRAEQLAERVEQKLTTALSQTNKFAVLDRRRLYRDNDEYLQEKNVLRDAPLEEQARIGQTLGADYILVGTATDAGLRIKRTGTEAIAGVTYTEYEADFAFDYRLIVASSRQIKFSDTVRLHLETADIKKLVRKWEPSDLNYDEIAENLIAKVAAEVINQLSDRLYPPRIAAIQSDGSIIIDQGGDRLVTGTVLEVVKPGQQITDSDTKELLGSTEILIATIRIDKVAPAMSYCSVVSGDASQLSQGLVCRIKSLPKQEVGGAKSQLEKTPQGGVKLPFD